MARPREIRGSEVGERPTMLGERRSMKSLSRTSPPCRVVRSADHCIADSCQPNIVPNRFAPNEFRDRQRFLPQSCRPAEIPCRPA